MGRSKFIDNSTRFNWMYFSKERNITAGPNGRWFLERPEEHVKSTHPCTGPDFIKSKKTAPKIKKANVSMNLEEVIPVKKAVAVGAKR